jgi:apolipoprotein N-acyltransferase
LTTFLQVVVCGTFGALHGLLFAAQPPFAWALQLFCITGAVYVLVSASTAAFSRLLMLSFALIFPWYFIGTIWLLEAFTDAQAFGLLLGIVATLLMCAWMTALPIVGLAATTFATSGSLPIWVRALLIGSTLSLAEYLRGVATGFRWLEIGYLQVDSPLASVFPTVGLYGVGWVICVTAALIGLTTHAVLRKQPQSLRLLAPVVVCVGTLLALTTLGREAPTAQPPVLVRLLQTQLPMHEKFDGRAYERYMARVAEWTAPTPQQEPIAFVLTPETMVPAPWFQLSAKWRGALAAAAAAGDTTIVLGILDHDESFGFVNRAALLAPRSAAETQLSGATYTKRTLVPLGEYAPPGLEWLSELLELPASQRSPGPPGQAVLQIDSVKVKPSICLDALVPSVMRADEEFGVITNQANLAWFPGEIVREQFLLALRARALEHGKPVLVSSNTGPTAAIGADGTIIERLSAKAEDVLTVRVSPDLRVTPYARLGDSWFLLLCAVSALIAVLQATLLARRRSMAT